MSDRPIFLVGFMGAGKTTVGRRLAEKLEYRFIDLDEIIEAEQGNTISAIFAEMGEAGFRQIERKALEDCCARARTVVALGGGAFVPAENRVVAGRIGRSVWLDCSVEVCLDRIADSSTRPLLGDRQSMRELFEIRRPSYAEADFRVETDSATPEAIAMRIVSLLGL